MVGLLHESEPGLSRRPQHALRLTRRLLGLGYELTPQLFAVLAFAAGALMLASAVTPELDERLRRLTGVVPPLLIDLSHFAASIAGFLLMLLSAGLWRRRRGAYWAALAVLAVGAVFSLLKGLDWNGSLDLIIVAALLAPCRTAFNRRSRLSEPLRPSWLLLLIAVVGAMLWLGFFAYRDVAYSDELWWRFITDRQASGFLRAGLALAVLTLVVAGRSLLSSPGAHEHGPPSPEEVGRARRVLAEADQATPEAWLAMLGDKALLFSPSGRSFLAYRVRGRRWIVMGEPAGAPEERQDLLWAFGEMADSYGGAPVFYSVGAEMLAELATMGLAVRKVGETAVVRTLDWTTEGRAKRNLRTAVSRAEREGGSFEVLPPGSARALEAELKAVSDAWLAMHNGEEKAFSMGRFDLDYLDLTPLAIIREAGRIVAFANLLVTRGEAAIDLMRHSPDAPHGVMDYLFTRCIQWAREQGVAQFDLGLAPLAGLEDRRLAPVFARVGALVYEEGGALYGFQGLRSYKAKFVPDWAPRFIAAPVSTPLPLALLDVALLTSGGWLGMLGLRKG
jgi:phosphatidylglycerol lysyltransferase